MEKIAVAQTVAVAQIRKSLGNLGPLSLRSLYDERYLTHLLTELKSEVFQFKEFFK